MKQLIETVKKCQLHVEINDNLRTWTMTSETTGTHTIRDAKDECNPLRPSARVKAHWKGFLRNQK